MIDHSAPPRGESATGWMGQCLPPSGMVCGCAWEKKKRRRDGGSGRGGQTCLIRRKGRWGCAHFLFSREKDYTCKERLGGGKKKWMKESEDADIKRKRGLGEWEIRGISPRDPINLQPGVNHTEGCQSAGGPHSFLWSTDYCVVTQQLCVKGS